MDDSNIKLITNVIASYAAIISTLLLIWNIFIYKKDKGNLTVSCYFGNVVGINLQSEKQLAFNITNIGRRDIVVTNIYGLDFKKKLFMIFAGIENSPKLPLTLKPGEFIIELIKNYEGILKLEIKDLYATDSIGNKYFVKRKEIKELVLSYNQAENKI